MIWGLPVEAGSQTVKPSTYRALLQESSSGLPCTCVAALLFISVIISFVDKTSSDNGPKLSLKRKYNIKKLLTNERYETLDNKFEQLNKLNEIIQVRGNC